MTASSPPAPESPAKARFAAYLQDLLRERGAQAELSRDTGIPTAHLSKIVAGDHLPREGTLVQLLNGFKAAERRQLLVYYLLDQVPPEWAGMVKVGVPGKEGMPADRLDEVLQFLNPVQRERIAVILEAAQRAPEKGWAAIEAIAELVGAPMGDGEGEPAKEPERRRPVRYEPGVEGLRLRVAEE